MLRDRRAFLAWCTVAWSGAGALFAGQRPQGQSSHPERPKDDDAPTSMLPPKAALKENEKDIKKDIEKLFQLAGELKAEVEKTDSSVVLSLPLLRKAEEIEKLAREIKNRAKG